MAGGGEYEQYYGKGGSSAPTPKWGAPPVPRRGAPKKGDEGWVSWGLGLVGVGSGKKQEPQVLLLEDGKPWHWARRGNWRDDLPSATENPYTPHQASATVNPYAPQQPSLQRLSAANQTPSASGSGVFNQPTMSSKTGKTKMSWKDYK